MRIPDILKKKKTLSFEFFPPKKPQKIFELYQTVESILKYEPDFVSITDSGIWGKTKHIALSKILKEKFSLNVMIHLTCVNNTLTEIKKVLKEVKKNEIKNVLVLKGDLVKDFKTPNSFSNSLDLLPIIPKGISKGVALYPSSHPDTSIKREIELVKKKIDLGAEFGITQLFLDIDEIKRMIERFKKANINLPIICGILPITSIDIFNNIVKKVKKISIPKEYRNIIQKFNTQDKKDDFYKASIDYITELIYKLLDLDISGIHFFTLNKNKGVREVIKRTKICSKLNQ